MRLDSIAPEMTAKLRSASVQQQKAASMVACEYAVEKCGIKNQTVEKGLKSLRERGALTTSLLRDLNALSKQLDDNYFRLQDLAESDATLKRDYLRSFSEARAVSALTFAASPDPLEAAAEAIYEAASTVDDPRDLFRLVNDLLHAG